MVKIKELNFLTLRERDQLLNEFNNTHYDYGVPQNVQPAVFEDNARKFPDTIAAIHLDDHISYNELNERSNQIAYLLRNVINIKNEFVGIHLDRNINYLSFFIAIFKAGAMYLPLSKGNPEDRTAFYLKDSRAKSFDYR